MKELIFHRLEFENEVRKRIGKPTGPITSEDALEIKEIDCISNLLCDEDLDTLCEFKNLEVLYIEMHSKELDFLSTFSKLKVLDITYPWSIDCGVFLKLKNLVDLSISGGDHSSIDILNIEILEQLPDLTALMLHEFGTVDLKVLERLPNLTRFYCGYADDVANIASIGSLRKLEDLILIAVETEDLDFLDELPESMSLQLCAIEVHAGINEEKFQRFREVDICDLTINQEWFPYECYRRGKQTDID